MGGHACVLRGEGACVLGGGMGAGVGELLGRMQEACGVGRGVEVSGCRGGYHKVREGGEECVSVLTCGYSCGLAVGRQVELLGVCRRGLSSGARLDLEAAVCRDIGLAWRASMPHLTSPSPFGLVLCNR